MFSHPEIWILAAGIFLGYFAQTIVGFAAALISFPFLLRVYTLPEATAFLAFYYVIFSAVLVYKNRKDVDIKVFKDLALPAFLGYIIGFVILTTVNPVWLERGLGIFVICYSAYEFKFKKVFNIPKILFNVFGFFGGIFGGIFSSGGSFFVPLIASRIKNAINIRATLLAVFAIANFSRFPFVIVSGDLTKAIFTKSLIILPVFLLAIICGQKAYNYISEKVLKNLILVFLFISGVFLVLK